ncbi:MAG: hypothetical protein JNK78_05895 [Planctomycetes bacterium]|nr:hypothetical protein [Planctomycetota bacterium]
MMHEVRSIPPAPRRIRMRPVFAHRWPLLAIGAMAIVSGCLLAWLMFLQSGGKPSDQDRLERGPTRTVAGHVVAVEKIDGHVRQQVRYHFDWDGVRHDGSSSAPAGTIAAGDDIEVVVLEEQPGINAAKGTVIFVDRGWLRPRFWLGILAVPGALLLLGWLAGSFQLRQVLVHGDAAVGRVTAISTVRFVLPEMLRVRYEFRDHRAVVRAGSHWVRLHGDLGDRLARQMRSGRFEAMPVLHDRRLPQWNRLILPQDFLPNAAAPTVPANGNA